MYKILSINPGSTSTKFSVHDDDKLVSLHTIRHSGEDLKQYKNIFDQYNFRKELILRQLCEDEILLDELSAVVGRGGMLHPLDSGVYNISKNMIDDVRRAAYGEHASNLGCVIAYEIASGIAGCRAYITDPVCVDEFEDVARISGLPGIPRRSLFHALNHKAVARKFAAANGTSYEKLNLVVAHLGGGISVAAHRLGKVIDVNQALDGYGPFSPERTGTVDAGRLLDVCFSGEYSKAQIKKMLVGEGGLMAHLGTNEVIKAVEMAENCNDHAALVLDAMAYNVAKEIGAMMAVLKGDTDAIIITGGIAYSQLIVRKITAAVAHFAKVVVYPGEDEMSALAAAGLRALRGETVKEYL